MLLALGVAGAANAVQMHGVIEGKVNNIGKEAASTWGSLTSAPILFDLWFDSSLISSYSNQSIHSFLKLSAPDITVVASYNGVTRSLVSQYRWDIQDNFIGNDGNKDLLNISVMQNSPSSLTPRAVDFHLAFADGSNSALKEIFLGHSIGKNALPLSTPSQSSNIYYGALLPGNNLSFTPTSFSIAPVPEPETWAMMLLGLGVVGYAARRRAAG
jgi:hypothetical protein